MLLVGMDEVVFDTLALEQSLRDAGFDERQATSLVRAIADSQQGLVTTDHLHRRLAVRERRLDGLDLKVSSLAQRVEALNQEVAWSPTAAAGPKMSVPYSELKLEQHINRVQSQLIFRLGTLYAIGTAILAALFKS